MLCSNKQRVSAGHLYHSDSPENLLRWHFEGDQQSESEDEGDVVLNANDLNHDEEILERCVSLTLNFTMSGLITAASSINISIVKVM